MKLTQHFLSLVLSTCCLVGLHAQDIPLPNISSQYLTQGNDYAAAQLTIEYKEGKANWKLGGETAEFTQQNLYTFLDKKFEKMEAEVAQQSNIKVDAPSDLPIHFLQDLYAWVQIYGNNSLHLAMYESMEPNKKQYLPINVLPFTVLEKACEHYASSSRGASTAIGAFTQVHPNTERLTTDKKANLSLTAKKVRPEHYIPQNILHIVFRENNEVIFKGQQVNPMVLGSLIQSELAKNYGNSYEKAAASKYLWLNLKMDKNVTYQQYAEIQVALQEAFHLYWEELAFNKFQNTYLELDVQQRWSIQQAAPKLIGQYDAIELLFIEEKLSSGDPKTWSELK